MYWCDSQGLNRKVLSKKINIPKKVRLNFHMDIKKLITSFLASSWVTKVIVTCTIINILLAIYRYYR